MYKVQFSEWHAKPRDYNKWYGEFRTLASAIRASRNFIGSERNERYKGHGGNPKLHYSDPNCDRFAHIRLTEVD